MRSSTRGVVVLALSMALIVSMFPPPELIDYVFWALSTDFNAAPEVFIMFSAVLLLLAGFLLAYSFHTFLSVWALKSDFFRSLCSQLGSLNMLLNRGGGPALVAASLLIVFWHMPSVLDVAFLQFRLHVIMNMSLVLAGFLIFVGAIHFTETMRKIVAFLAHMAMGIFGVFLLVTSGYNRFYAIYPLYQQAQLGLLMVIMMFALDGLLLPYWLYRYFSKPLNN